MITRIITLIPDPLDRVWCALAFATIVIGQADRWLP